jgi:hypothetical protein
MKPFGFIIFRNLTTTSILLSLIALSTHGCSTPLVVGGQITEIPPGFMFDANATGARLVFHEREKVDQRGYFYMTHDDEHCSIMISEFSGPTSYEEAKSALDYHRTTYPEKKYGALESMQIDGEDAWGWESFQHHKGETTSLEYHAIVSYPELNTTYTIEFYAGVERFMDAKLIKATVGSFAVKKEKEVSYAQIGLIALLVVGFAVGIQKIRT